MPFFHSLKALKAVKTHFIFKPAPAWMSLSWTVQANSVGPRRSDCLVSWSPNLRRNTRVPLSLCLSHLFLLPVAGRAPRNCWKGHCFNVHGGKNQVHEDGHRVYRWEVRATDWKIWLWLADTKKNSINLLPLIVKCSLCQCSVEYFVDCIYHKPRQVGFPCLSGIWQMSTTSTCTFSSECGFFQQSDVLNVQNDRNL